MKLNLHTTFLYIAFFLFTNVYAQNSYQDVNFSLVNNEIFSLDQLKGNVVVINIYNPSYPNSNKIPHEIVARYKNEKVVFLTITDNPYKSSIAFSENNAINYQTMKGDEAERIFNTYQTSMFKVFPIHVIIDQEGKVSYKRKGTVKNIENKISKKIDGLLINAPFDEAKIPTSISLND